MTEITRNGLIALCEKLGVVNTIRFINQFHAGYGNYTEERDQLFAGMTVDEIVTEIKRARKTEPGRADENKNR
jgi:hypothetical protein